MQQSLGTNPLQAFELIAHIGEFMQPWSTPKWSNKIKFSPNDLLRFCTVSRTYRAALLPVLWRVYDGDEMLHIPHSIISKYSHHFRYFFNCGHLGPFFTARLHVLCVRDTFRRYSPPLIIARLSPDITLSTLVWSGHGNPLDLSEPLDPPPTTAEAPGDEGYIAFGKSPARLSCMPTTITKLVLQRWTINDELDFLMFLTRFNRLSTLWLSDIHDFNAYPTHSSSSRSTSTIPSHSSGTLTVPVLLPSVRKVRLCFSTPRSMAILEIVKCCPNLEQLEIHGGWISCSDQYQTLVLHPYCPQLSSLSARLHWNDVAYESYSPEDPALALLIKSLTRGPKLGHLKTLKLEFMCFGEHAADAIANIDTLEVLELLEDDNYILYSDGTTDEDEASREDLVGHASLGRLHRVLTQLPRLRVLIVDIWYVERPNDKTEHPLFRGEPWACLKSLEELSLVSVGHNPANRILHGIEVQDERAERWLWRAEKEVWISDVLESILKEQLEQMPRLRRFSFKRVSFLKMKLTDRVLKK